MATPRDTRRLAAILAADVVSYSRLMETDEAGTLARFKAARSEVIDPAVAEYGGRMVKTTGDGFLCEFPSAVDAVQCAIAFQEAMSEREPQRADDDRLRIRIGINLGDIIIDDDDVFGDGVNIAARLEGIAEPGGIAISGTAHDTLRGALAEAFENAGEQNVKNISRSIRVYVWARTGGASHAPAARPEPGAGVLPTIAVTQFEGSDSEAADMAGAIHDGVQSALANLMGLISVTDPDKADFVLSARIQARRGRYRATALLLDRELDKRFWSERFDAETDDPFQAEDDLVTRISGAARFAIYAYVVEKRGAVAPEDADTQTLLSQAGFLSVGPEEDHWLQARALTEKVIEREPDNGMAWATNSVTYLYHGLLGHRRPSDADVREALERARRAVALISGNEFARGMLSIALIMSGDLAAGRREAERCLELNPYSPIGKLQLAQALLYGGRAEEAIKLSTEAADIFKRFPLYAPALALTALGHLCCGRHADAIEWGERALVQDPRMGRVLVTMIAAAAESGDIDTAKSYAEQLLTAHPDFTIAGFGPPPFKDPQTAERLIEGLRRAGVPEE